MQDTVLQYLSGLRGKETAWSSRQPTAMEDLSWIAFGSPSADHQPGSSAEQCHTPWIGDGDLDFGLCETGPVRIEDIYADVHRSIDQIRSSVTHETVVAPDQIKEENRKVFEKLSHLEHEVQQRSSVAPTSPSASHGETNNPLRKWDLPACALRSLPDDA